MNKTRIHFHTFDALRFFSFLLVFFSHVPEFGVPEFAYLSKSGGVGVSFFFVLSGFLITYLLLEEKTTSSKISLKNFFMRRVLRIWPLFYGMLVLAFFTPYLIDYFNLPSSNEGYEPNWLMSILFLENYNIMISDNFPNVSPLRVMWSLCIEEHFYILWGISFYYISLKNIPYLLLFSIVLSNVLRVVYSHFNIEAIDVFTNIDYFAYGAIPAYIFVLKKDVLLKIEALSAIIKYLIVIATIVLVFVFPNIQNEISSLCAPIIYGILFSGIILFTLTEKNTIYMNDRLWISKLGIYTYGLYLFHTVVINFLINTKTLIHIEMNWFFFSLVALLITILVSWLSYHLFEKQFLKLKKHYSKYMQ